MAGSDIIVTKNIVTDQHDELVQTTSPRSSRARGGEVDENIGTRSRT